MNTHRPHLSFVSTRKVLVLALLAAFGPAQAEDREIDALIQPNESTVSVGMGTASGSGKERALFGQYNGISRQDSALLLDFEYIRREEDTGLWTLGEGRNLGRDDRELSFSREKQGDWKYAVEYGEQVHRDPLTVNTGVRGVGTVNPIATKLATLGSGADINLDLRRKAFALSGVKRLSPNLTVEANFKTEDKEGTRLSGIGGYCSNAISPICPGATSTAAALFFLPEPVNSTTQQIEGEIHYFDEKLTLTGGYYGSFYRNSNSTVALSGVGAVLGAGATQAALAANLGQPVALPPDNQAHQFYVSGTYALQPSTRANFKLAYTHATQDESFGVLGAGGLGGALDTTLAQVGLTTRPAKDLALNFSGRYEEKKDSTRLGNYLVDSAGTLYTNARNNSQRMNGKAEALYQFSSHYRGLLAVDFGQVNRDRPIATTYIPSTSMAAMRERTNEVGVRAELRRSMSETVNAAISVGHSERDGYRWYALNPTSGYAFMSYAASSGLSGTFPMSMVDRSRDNYKVMVDWTPTEDLSIQTSFEDGTDRFKGPTSAGLNDTNASSFNIDAAYKLNDKWALTGYAGSGKQTLRMRQEIGYIADLANLSTSMGFGVIGKISSKLEVGGNLSFVEDRNRYQIAMTTGAAVSNAPPDETYRSTAIKLHGKYSFDKSSAIQVELVHQRVEYDQWAWINGGVPFSYSDGSTITMQPVQDVTFIGARYIYKFK